MAERHSVTVKSEATGVLLAVLACGHEEVPLGASMVERACCRV